jgi:hypothetical protein
MDRRAVPFLRQSRPCLEAYLNLQTGSQTHQRPGDGASAPEVWVRCGEPTLPCGNEEDAERAIGAAALIEKPKGWIAEPSHFCGGLPRRRRTAHGLEPPPSFDLPCRENRERPIPPIRYQPRTDRIFQNILRFLLETLVVAKSMLKKIPLPIESKSAGRPSFPIADTFGCIVLGRKAEHEVNMIWHNGGGMDPPNAGLHTMKDRFPHSAGCIWRGKRLKPPILSATGYEKHSARDIYPRRKIVGQGLAAGNHRQMM